MQPPLSSMPIYKRWNSFQTSTIFIKNRPPVYRRILERLGLISLVFRAVKCQHKWYRGGISFLGGWYVVQFQLAAYMSLQIEWQVPRQDHPFAPLLLPPLSQTTYYPLMSLQPVKIYQTSCQTMRGKRSIYFQLSVDALGYSSTYKWNAFNFCDLNCQEYLLKGSAPFYSCQVVFQFVLSLYSCT